LGRLKFSCHNEKTEVRYQHSWKDGRGWGVAGGAGLVGRGAVKSENPSSARRGLKPTGPSLKRKKDERRVPHLNRKKDGATMGGGELNCEEEWGD